MRERERPVMIRHKRPEMGTTPCRHNLCIPACSSWHWNADRGPGGVIEAGNGPTRVIAGVEAPQSVECGHRQAVLLDIEHLR